MGLGEFTHPDDLARDMDLLDRLADGDLPYYVAGERAHEAASLVVPLGAFVLQEACGFLARHSHFTRRLGDNGSGDQISSAVASLAANLGMYGVVEGHGWLYGQGYLYGRPMPEARIAFDGKARACDAFGDRVGSDL